MAPKTSSSPIHLNGTTLEGGGQLLRIALCLSGLTHKPLTITNIRGNRSGGGGLKAQHLTSLQWLGRACNARLSGVGLKSKEITFTPGQTPSSKTTSSFFEGQGDEVRINQSTPGSTSLILQAILPYILFTTTEPVRLRITGGTNVSNSPSCDYIAHVLLPMLELIGLPEIKTQVHSRGWSQGSTCLGSVTYTIPHFSAPLPSFHLTERGDIVRIEAIVIAPRETERDFRENLEHIFDTHASKLFPGSESPQETQISFSPSHHDKRYYILLVATSSTGIKLGRDWLYDRAIRPGKLESIVPTMVKRVIGDLEGEIAHGGCVDEYMRDQLIVFQALAKGKSEVDPGRTKEGGKVGMSLHAKTGVWVTEQVLGVEVDDVDGVINGIGYMHGPGAEEEVIEKIAKLQV